MPALPTSLSRLTDTFALNSLFPSLPSQSVQFLSCASCILMTNLSFFNNHCNWWDPFPCNPSLLFTNVNYVSYGHWLLLSSFILYCSHVRFFSFLLNIFYDYTRFMRHAQAACSSTKDSSTTNIDDAWLHNNEVILPYTTPEDDSKATLETLLRFLNWIPLGYIFETTIIDLLLNRVRRSRCSEKHCHESDISRERSFNPFIIPTVFWWNSTIVTPFNIAYLQELVRHGPTEYPGARYVVLENGLTFGIINEQMLSFNTVGL